VDVSGLFAQQKLDGLLQAWMTSAIEPFPRSLIALEASLDDLMIGARPARAGMPVAGRASRRGLDWRGMRRRKSFVSWSTHFLTLAQMEWYLLKIAFESWTTLQAALGMQDQSDTSPKNG
jgi:hypothetical protein